MTYVRPADHRAGTFGLLVTDDKKVDWRTGDLAHPVLSAEYKAAIGLDLGVCTVNEMQTTTYFKTLMGSHKKRS